jgi:hypothetical protein
LAIDVVGHADDGEGFIRLVCLLRWSFDRVIHLIVYHSCAVDFHAELVSRFVALWERQAFPTFSADVVTTNDWPITQVTYLPELSLLTSLSLTAARASEINLWRSSPIREVVAHIDHRSARVRLTWFVWVEIACFSSVLNGDEAVFWSEIAPER